MPLVLPLEQVTTAGSSIVIEEEDASTPGGSPMRLVLVGAGLPKRGAADWGTELREKTTWYPGNGLEASQQVLGLSEMPSTWSGAWKRLTLVRAPCTFSDERGAKRLVADPPDLHAALDRLQRGGARLRATWTVRGSRITGTNPRGTVSDVEVQISRVGRMTQVKVTPGTEADYEWTVSWTWLGRGAKQTRVSAAGREEDLSTAADAVAQSVAALDALVGSTASAFGLPSLPTPLTIGQLESVADAPLGALESVQGNLRYNLGQFARVAQLARKVATTPLALKNAAKALAENTSTLARRASDDIEAIPAEYRANTDRPSAIARASRHVSRCADALALVERRGNDLAARTRGPVVAGGNRGEVSVSESATTRAGALLAVHACKAGDTPERVATRYYGSPDLAAAILRANRLPAHTPSFRPGEIVVIPVPRLPDE